MSIERFPWLNDAIRAHQKITFPSSSIIEGESGLAKKQLAKYFAQKLLCSDEFAPCLSLIHISEPRDRSLSRMPSSA